MTPDYCPNCGAAVPERARSCPECGADESTGWSDDAHAERLGIPRDDFDAEAFAEEEFGEPSRRQRPNHRLWFVTAVLLLASILFFWLR